MTDYIFPGIDENPGEGVQVIDTNYRCDKCIRYGTISGGDSQQRINPCTICVMANGGCWGWEHGHYGDPRYSRRSNGIPPGNDGITDCLNNHNDEHDLTEWSLTDEEVVLGFAQFALYNHYKWKDILDLLPGKSKLRTGVPPREYLNGSYDSEDKYDKNWYWWKIIPDGVVLPKRLMIVLQRQLVKYELERINPELFIPKTHQLKGDREISDDIWETFWDTYVEPGHVVHLFKETLESILHTIIPYSEVLGINGFLSARLDSFSIQNYSTTTSIPEESREIPEQDILWLERCQYSVFTGEESKHFIISGEGEIFERSGSSKIILRIMDRDVFGSDLYDVINYPENVYRRPLIRNGDSLTEQSNTDHASQSSIYGITTDFTGWQQELWNTLTCDLNPLFYDVYRILSIEDTYHWIGLNENQESEFVQEMDFRFEYTNGVQSYIIDTIPDNIPEIEQESELDWSKHIDKLKDIESLIDESVKSKISNGTYLELMDHLKDIYLLCKN